MYGVCVYVCVKMELFLYELLLHPWVFWMRVLIASMWEWRRAAGGVCELAVYRVLSMMIWLRNLFGFVPYNLPIYMLILMLFGNASSSTSFKDNVPGIVKQVQNIMVKKKLNKRIWNIRASDSSFGREKILKKFFKFAYQRTKVIKLILKLFVTKKSLKIILKTCVLKMLQIFHMLFVHLVYLHIVEQKNLSPLCCHFFEKFKFLKFVSWKLSCSWYLNI